MTFATRSKITMVVRCFPINRHAIASGLHARATERYCVAADEIIGTIQ